jgi:flagellar hook-associated protein 2
MADITFTGLASGIPPDLVDKLVELQQAPLNRLADQKIEQQTRLQAVQDLNARLLTMKAAMEALDGASDFQARQAASSDTDFVTVSASGAADRGTYTVTDVVLAAGDQKRHTAGVASKTDPLASGTFAFTYAGGTEQQVTISGGETLQDLVGKINDLDAGVHAGIINDGTQDYLVLTGDDTGAGKTMAITANTTITGFEAVDFTDTETEQDASFTIDGLAVTGASNTFANVLEGVTIDLEQATSGESITLSITQDTDTVVQKVKDFVAAYNDVAAALEAHTKYDADTGQRTVLFGDSAVRGIQFKLRDMLVSRVEGLSGTYTTLAELGITTDTATGTLEVDDTKLKAAVDSDFEGIGKLFYEDTAGGTTGYAAQLVSYLETVTDAATGMMPGKESAITAQIKALDRQIETTQRRVDLASERIRNQFVSLETLISELDSQTSGALQTLQNLSTNPIRLGANQNTNNN